MKSKSLQRSSGKIELFIHELGSERIFWFRYAPFLQYTQARATIFGFCFSVIEKFKIASFEKISFKKVSFEKAFFIQKPAFNSVFVFVKKYNLRLFLIFFLLVNSS
jgi:hypothetical protein